MAVASAREAASDRDDGTHHLLQTCVGAPAMDVAKRSVRERPWRARKVA
jgi:hypothetical protein